MGLYIAIDKTLTVLGSTVTYKLYNGQIAEKLLSLLLDLKSSRQNQTRCGYRLVTDTAFLRVSQCFLHIIVKKNE